MVAEGEEELYTMCTKMGGKVGRYISVDERCAEMLMQLQGTADDL